MMTTHAEHVEALESCHVLNQSDGMLVSVGLMERSLPINARPANEPHQNGSQKPSLSSHWKVALQTPPMSQPFNIEAIAEVLCQDLLQLCGSVLSLCLLYTSDAADERINV